MNRVKAKYVKEIVPALTAKFNYTSVMQVPKLDKIILNMRLGDIKDNGKSVQNAAAELSNIAGQKAVLTKAKSSVSNFKVREGMSLGAKVTLRGDRMWEFYDKLVSLALPKVRDFHGVPAKFDGKGNYNLGIKEQLVFPEIDYDKIEKVKRTEKGGK